MSSGVILCVDDEDIILNSLEDQLNEEFGDEYIIELAQSADEGLEIVDEIYEEMGAESCGVLVVISDWLMPGMKGDEFLIKVHQKCPKVMKVMLTGQADKDAIQRAKDEANLQKCMSKPWDAKELIATIKKGLSNG